MAKSYYLPRRESEQAGWFPVFSRGIGKYGLSLGLTAAEITDAQANCAFGVAVLHVQYEVGQYAQSITHFKDAVLWATEQVTAWPTGYTLPTNLPPFSHAGVVPLLTVLIARIKQHPAYTTEIGQEMGIEGTVHTQSPAVLATLKPLLKLRLDQGGHPFVDWKKLGMDSLECWVDRGDGKGYVFLCTDTHPGYLDTAPLPAAGASAVWKYKAIYRQADAQVGQWSDEVKISVMGA